jgi:hypothetical protein
MNAEVFAEWLRRQGYRVLQTESSYWYEASRFVYQSFPFHQIIEPSEEEIQDLFHRNPTIAVRYSTPFECPQGSVSYHAVYQGSSYDMDTLDRRSRQNVRNGLSRCEVRHIPVSELAEKGWELEDDTASRQGRDNRISRERWQRRYLAAAELPGFEAWGAFIDDQLAASMLAFEMGDCYELISQQCKQDCLNTRANNALIFTVTQSVCKRASIRSIFYTIQSLDAPPSVDEFKFRMGYRPLLLKQRVVFSSFARYFATPAAYRIISKLRQKYPSNPFYSKTEGVLRFYLNGLRAAEDQVWPDCLRERLPSSLERIPVAENDVFAPAVDTEPVRR